MKKLINLIKKLTSLAAISGLLISLSCCGVKEEDPVLSYATRAAVAVTNNMNSSASGFRIVNAEYSIENGSKKVTLECIYNLGDMNLEKHVFVVGEGGEFFDLAIDENRAVIDKLTGLCVIDYGDKAYIKNDDNQIDTNDLFKNYEEYIKNEDPALLGMESSGIAD
ncbi:MAG: hypothetical protein LBR74_02330 [Eubacterium sp.]|jgi:hypothetical protein|nr:hypothetical protein [Eubacterium sp.]